MYYLIVFVFGFYSILIEGFHTNQSINENLKQTISSELDSIGNSWPHWLQSGGRPLQQLLSSVTFVCDGRFEGYYADIGFKCQTFHYCKQNGLRFTFMCPHNSIFNQKEMTCDHNVSEPELVCSQSHKYYNLNAFLYNQTRNSVNGTEIASFETMGSKNWFFNSPSVEYLKTRAPMPTISVKTNETQKRKESIDSLNKSIVKTEDWLPLASISMAAHKRLDSNSSAINISMLNVSDHSLEGNPIHLLSKNITHLTKVLSNENNSSDLSLKQNINVFNESQTDLPNIDIDWDDSEDRLEFPTEPLHTLPFRQNPMTSLPQIRPNHRNSAPFSLPSIPVPLINSGPIYVLKPDPIPSTLPIDNLYQHKYSLGKPQTFQNTLYANPNYGPPLIGPPIGPPVMSPQLIGPPIGLMPITSETLYPKIYPKNSKLFSNFQNVLTKLSFNDIFNLRIPFNQMNPKRKGSDSVNPSLHNPSIRSGKPSLKPFANKFDSNINFRPDLRAKPLIITERVSDSDIWLNTNTKNTIPLELRKIIVLNGKPIDLRIDSNLSKPSKPNVKPKNKYSLRDDETIDSKHILQPSSFLNSNGTDIQKKQKWIDSYAKIKKKYIEREKKFQNKMNRI